MSDETYPLYARHVSSCEVCAEKVAAFRASALNMGAATVDEHLSELDVAALADEADDALLSERRGMHLAVCGSCRASFAALCDLLGDERVDSAVRELEAGIESRLTLVAPPVRRRVAAGVFAAAAALLIAVASGLHYSSVTRTHDTPSAPSATEPLRHATISTAAAPRLVEPSGAVARVDTLRWTEVPRADLYHVIVFDSTGSIAWQVEASAALTVVPDSVRKSWSGRYSWFVKARTSVDRWVASDFTEFDLPQRTR